MSFSQNNLDFNHQMDKKASKLEFASKPQIDKWVDQIQLTWGNNKE